MGNAHIQAAARYLDVVSTNYGAEFNDGSLSRFYLDALHRTTQKPILVTEYYFAAMENRSSNSNRGAIFPTVQTQAERARSFAHNLSSLAALPYVTGAHWFQYRDEPGGGRAGDGEDYNMGLVDTRGAPYEELTEAAKRIDVAAIHRSQKSSEPAKIVAPSSPYAWNELEAWPRKQHLIEPGEPAAPADLYARREGEWSWIAIHYMDFAEPKLYRRPDEFDGDGARVTIRSPGLHEITLTVHADGTVRCSSPLAQARLIQRGTRYVLMARIPKTSSLQCNMRSAGGAWRASWSVH